MLYKVIIADDEKRTLLNLKNHINWQKAGFKVVGAADNGEIALELIHKNKPHAVISDIVMPKIEGLELAKRTLRLYPETRFIILSAYDEFKYAQQAIKFGVCAYLLKPADEELFEELRKIRVNLDNHKLNLPIPAYNEDEKPDFNSLIKKTKKYVFDNIQEKITLNSAAKHLFVSPSYLSYYFKKETGQNFIEYVTYAKIELAKSMLKRSDYCIKEIADMVGFSDFAYFCKVFKSHESLTALEYRARFSLE